MTYRAGLSLVLVQLLTFGSMSAQVLQPTPTPLPLHGVDVSLDVLKPGLKSEEFGFDFSTLTTINHLGVRWALGDVALTADLPYVHVGVSGASGSSTLIGNIGLGFVSTAKTGFQGGMEVLVPTFSGGGDDDGDFASIVGLVGDYQNFEFYLNDLISARGTLGYRWAQGTGPAVTIVARPALLKPSDGSVELLTDLGVQADYGVSWWNVGAAVTTRYWVTQNEPETPFGKLVTEFDLGFRGTFGAFQPGVYARISLDDDLKVGLGPSLGFRMSYAFGR